MATAPEMVKSVSGIDVNLLVKGLIAKVTGAIVPPVAPTAELLPSATGKDGSSMK